MKFFTFFISAFLLLTFATQANATTLVPDKLVIESNERTGTLTLMNTDPKTTFLYTFDWGDFMMDETGKRTQPEKAEDYPEGYKSAKDFIRFSPRRIVLRPNQQQQIRFLVRRTKDMPEGDLRAQFYAIPQTPPNIDKPTNETDEEEEPTEVVIGVQFLITKGIPVYIKNGEARSEVNLTSAELRKEFSEKRDTYEDRIYYTLTADGNTTAHGKVIANCLIGGEERFAGGIGRPIYREVKTLSSYVALRELPEGGCDKLTLTYVGDGTDQFFKRRLISSIDVETK